MTNIGLKAQAIYFIWIAATNDNSLFYMEKINCRKHKFNDISVFNQDNSVWEAEKEVKTSIDKNVSTSQFVTAISQIVTSFLVANPINFPTAKIIVNRTNLAQVNLINFITPGSGAEKLDEIRKKTNDYYEKLGHKTPFTDIKFNSIIFHLQKTLELVIIGESVSLNSHKGVKWISKAEDELVNIINKEIMPKKAFHIKDHLLSVFSGNYMSHLPLNKTIIKAFEPNMEMNSLYLLQDLMSEQKINLTSLEIEKALSDIHFCKLLKGDDKKFQGNNSFPTLKVLIECLEKRNEEEENE